MEKKNNYQISISNSSHSSFLQIDIEKRLDLFKQNLSQGVHIKPQSWSQIDKLYISVWLKNMSSWYVCM